MTLLSQAAPPDEGGETLLTRSSRLVNWLKTVGPIHYYALSCAGGAAVARTPTTVVALITFVILALWPGMVLLTATLGVEQVLTAGGHEATNVSSLVSVGSELYDARFLGVNAVVLIASATAVVSIVGRRAKLPWPPVVLLVVLVAWCTALGLSEGYSLFSSFVSASPWLVLLCGVVVGTTASLMPNNYSRLLTVFAIFMSIKATISVEVYLSGSSQTIGDLSVVFYDSTLPYISALTIIGVSLGRKYSALEITLLISSITIITLSPRRNAILAALFALIIAMALAKRFLYRGVTLVIALISVASLSAVLFPPALGALTTSVGSASSTALGDGSDSSTSGHLQDLAVGSQVVSESPFFGVGIFPTPRVGLVVSGSENLYIHNELLQSWARFGLPAILLLLAFIAISIRQSIYILKDAESTFPRVCAMLIVALPIPLFFFPQLSTSFRFSLLIGLAIGLVYRFRMDQEGRIGGRGLVAVEVQPSNDVSQES